MAEQRLTYLFDVGSKGWKKHTDAQTEKSWLDPQHLPDFGQIFHHVDSFSRPVYQAFVYKPHYMRAYLLLRSRVCYGNMTF